MEAWLVALVTVAAFLLFAHGRQPPDVIAVLVLGSLVILGLVTPEQAIGGFSSPATITVGAMFVMSAGLRASGALEPLARFLNRVGRFGPVLQGVVMAISSSVSAFINNTAAVAVLMPAVVRVARRRGHSPSKLLIPLSYAAQFGGVCTLIGTSTNLLVNSLAVGAGLAGFGLFDFAPLGLLLAGTGMVYLLTVGWWLLPRRTPTAVAEDAYALQEYLFTMTVPAGSRLVGRTVEHARLHGKGDVVLLEIVRGGQRFRGEAATNFFAGDTLVLQGAAESVLEMARREGLASVDQPSTPGLEGDGLQLVEVVVAPMARAIGRPLASIDSAWVSRSAPVAIARRADVMHTGLSSLPLAAGDALLLLVAGSDMQALREDVDFILLGERQSPTHPSGRAPLLAIAIVVVAVGIAACRILPIEIASLLGAAAMAIFRCVPLDRLYRSVELRVLVLLAAMLPLGLALQSSGAAARVVDSTLHLLPAGDPLLALVVIYGATAICTEFVTNNATAVLMTPIAIAMAAKLGVSPAPFLVAVAFAASTSFSTPIGYQTNTMVYGAGGYTFGDFLRVGLPLNLLFWAVSVWAIPRLFPF
jgi:di/tricarboxylate transporter